MCRLFLFVISLHATTLLYAQTGTRLTEKYFSETFLPFTWKADSTLAPEQKREYEDMLIAGNSDTLAMVYLNFLEGSGYSYCRYTWKVKGKWFEISQYNCDPQSTIRYIYGTFDSPRRVWLFFAEKKLKMEPEVMDRQKWIPFIRFKAGG